jgi:hypothetical protein
MRVLTREKPELQPFTIYKHYRICLDNRDNNIVSFPSLGLDATQYSWSGAQNEKWKSAINKHMFITKHIGYESNICFSSGKKTQT